MPKINPNTSTSNPLPANQTEERKPLSEEKLARLRKNTLLAIEILENIKALDEESERLRKG